MIPHPLLPETNDPAQYAAGAPSHQEQQAAMICTTGAANCCSVTSCSSWQQASSRLNVSVPHSHHRSIVSHLYHPMSAAPSQQHMMIAPPPAPYGYAPPAPRTVHQENVLNSTAPSSSYNNAAVSDAVGMEKNASSIVPSPASYYVPTQHQHQHQATTYAASGDGVAGMIDHHPAADPGQSHPQPSGAPGAGAPPPYHLCINPPPLKLTPPALRANTTSQFHLHHQANTYPYTSHQGHFPRLMVSSSCPLQANNTPCITVRAPAVTTCTRRQDRRRSSCSSTSTTTTAASSSSFLSHQDFTIKMQAEEIRQLEEKNKYLQELMKDNDQEVMQQHCPSPPTNKDKKRKQKKNNKTTPAKKKQRRQEDAPRRPSNGYNYFVIDERVPIEYYQERQDKDKWWEAHCKEKFRLLDEKKKAGRCRKKKKNAKGRMKLVPMVKMRSSKWQQLHPETKNYFQRLGEADSARYRREMKEYKEKNKNSKK